MLQSSWSILHTSLPKVLKSLKGSGYIIATSLCQVIRDSLGKEKTIPSPLPSPQYRISCLGDLDHDIKGISSLKESENPPNNFRKEFPPCCMHCLPHGPSIVPLLSYIRGCSGLLPCRRILVISRTYLSNSG